MKMSKKLLATQVNSVRPYKSRSKRPCDFCRRRKTCCIIDKSIPCMACAQFNKGRCTFVEEPLKRSKRGSVYDDDRISRHRKRLKGENDCEPALVSEGPSSVVQNSPVLAFPSELRPDCRHSALSRFGIPLGVSLWHLVMELSRSYSMGNVQNLNELPLQIRDALPTQQPDSVQPTEHHPLQQELVEEYKLYSIHQQQQSTSHYLSFRQASYPQPREPELLEGLFSLSQGAPYYHYNTGVDAQPLLDNSEFASLAGSNLSSRLGTAAWLPLTLDTANSALESLEYTESAPELEYVLAPKILPSQLGQPFHLGLLPFYYGQDSYAGFSNNGSYGVPSAVPTQGGAYQPSHMK